MRPTHKITLLGGAAAALLLAFAPSAAAQVAVSGTFYGPHGAVHFSTPGPYAGDYCPAPAYRPRVTYYRSYAPSYYPGHSSGYYGPRQRYYYRSDYRPYYRHYYRPHGYWRHGRWCRW